MDLFSKIGRNIFLSDFIDDFMFKWVSYFMFQIVLIGKDHSASAIVELWIFPESIHIWDSMPFPSSSPDASSTFKLVHKTSPKCNSEVVLTCTMWTNITSLLHDEDALSFLTDFPALFYSYFFFDRTENTNTKPYKVSSSMPRA